jgi:hypothetical protein
MVDRGRTGKHGDGFAERFKAGVAGCDDVFPDSDVGKGKLAIRVALRRLCPCGRNGMNIDFRAGNGPVLRVVDDSSHRSKNGGASRDSADNKQKYTKRNSEFGQGKPPRWIFGNRSISG